MRSIWIVSLVLLSPLGAWAGAGLSGAQIFQQDTAARPAGLAGAWVAGGGDSSSLAVNPAGLNDLTSNEVQFMHTLGQEGVASEFLVLAIPAPGLGVVALQALYRGQPAIDNGVPGEPAVEVKDMVFAAALARSLTEQWTLGVNLKLALMTLGPVDTAALAVDAGCKYQWDERLSLGLAGRNLGPGVSIHATEDPLPATLLTGAQYALLQTEPHGLQVNLQADYLIPEHAYTFRVSGEYQFRKMLILRLGYAHALQEQVSGLSTGVGFRFKAGRVKMAIDYAYLPQTWMPGDFNSENFVSLSVQF